MGSVTLPHLRTLAGLFAGDFLDGLEIDRSPVFGGWLASQRRRFRDRHIALLEHLVKIGPEDEVPGHLEKWLELAPFDHSVHEALFNLLARRGQIREGEEHLATSLRLFESEDLDGAPLRKAWRTARAQAQCRVALAFELRQLGVTLGGEDARGADSDSGQRSGARH